LTRRKRFPAAEIVYQSSGWEKPSLGFVNADGSGLKIIGLKTYYPNRPMWSAGRDSIIFIQPRHPIAASGLVGTFGGRISILGEDWRVRQCRNRTLWNVYSIEPIDPSTKQDEALIDNAGMQIILFAVDRCREISLHVDYVDDQDRNMIGASLSSDRRYVAFGESSGLRYPPKQYSINILDVQTGERRSVAEGINPSWSPENSMIAYCLASTILSP